MLGEAIQDLQSRNKEDLQPAWEEKIEDLPDDHDPSDRMQAMAQAFQDETIPVGLFYQELRPTLESHTHVTDHPMKANGRDFDVRALLEIYR